MSPNKNILPLVVIVGPTAVGKTDLAIQLAEQLNGEIVSADSRLFYRGMDIGTAKPTAKEMARVPHHLIDVADPDDTWSLAIFQKSARDAIGEIERRHKLPFLVGGTGQYIRAVTEGWTPPDVQPDPRLRIVLDELVSQHSATWLHERLRILDPVSADKIDSRNVRRTIRAMEVIFSTGQSFSTQRGIIISDYFLITIGLKRPRPELYARVDERIELMFENGLLDEVKKLLEQGYASDLPSMSAIGYREAIAVIKNEMSLEDAKIQMKRMTRIFVRRQGNWFKEDNLQIKWFDVHTEPLLLIRNYIQTSLAAFEQDK